MKQRLLPGLSRYDDMLSEISSNIHAWAARFVLSIFSTPFHLNELKLHENYITDTIKTKGDAAFCLRIFHVPPGIPPVQAKETCLSLFTAPEYRVPGL
ncbi:hypothetical protein GCM10009415_06460 [Chitinophaga japonensis]